MKRTLCVFGFAGLMWLILAVMGAGFPLPFQHNFFTVNTAPVNQTTAGSNVFVTFTQVGQTRTYLIDVPTNGPGGGNIVQTNGFTSIVYTNPAAYVLTPGGIATNLTVWTGTENGVLTITNATNPGGHNLIVYGDGDFTNLTAYGNVTTIGGGFYGNGTSISSLSAGNLQGTVPESVMNHNLTNLTLTGPIQIYGSTVLTNGAYISPIGELFSNANSSILISGGSITGLTATFSSTVSAGSFTGGGGGITGVSAASVSGGATNQVYAYGSSAGWTGNVGVSNVTMSGNLTFSKDIVWTIGTSGNRPLTTYTYDLQAGRDVYVSATAGGNVHLQAHVSMNAPNANELQVHGYNSTNYARLIVSNLISGDLIIGTNSVASYCSNKLAVTTISVGASAFNWTNTLTKNVFVFIAGGTVSEVDVNGTALGTGLTLSGLSTIPLQPGEWVTTTYSLAPTMTWKPF
jgi:hypothetical protein